MGIDGIQWCAEIVEVLGDLFDVVVEHVSVLQACEFLVVDAIFAVVETILEEEGHAALEALQD